MIEPRDARADIAGCSGTITGNAINSTVFDFEVIFTEVACGRRPLQTRVNQFMANQRKWNDMSNGSGLVSKISVRSRVLIGVGFILLMLIGVAGFSAVLIRGIDSNFHRSLEAVSQKSIAVDIDLVMAKVRVRVNQLLRSTNPDFARNADELLQQDVELVAKAAANAATEKQKKIVSDIDRALTGYIASWRVFQEMTAEDTRFFAEKIQAPSVGIRTALTKLVDSATAQNELDERRFVNDARIAFMDAQLVAFGFRAGSIKDAVAPFNSAIADSLVALEKAKKIAAVPADIEAMNRAVDLIRAWNDNFLQATKLAAARAARLDSWTRNEGEAMAVGANALRVEAEAISATAEKTFVAELGDSQTTLYTATPIIILVGVVLGLLLTRSITVPLARITATLRKLSTGDRSLNVPDTGRRDEIGEMARAAQVFKDNLVEADHLRQQQALAEQDVDVRRKADMQRLADQFEGAVSEIIQTVSSAATEMEASANSLTMTADRTQELSKVVAAAAEEASVNVQSVASASEEMTSCVNEISRQVQESALIASGAVQQAQGANGSIRELSDAAKKIGSVLDLINTIARQTNLLALNATIEAARAGESGRGFAVVASEVKSLADQTAKATGEIGQQIAAMQTATESSVFVIGEIASTINRISEISSTIASAVEEQGAATNEISRNVQQASQGTTDVASNIADVQRGSSETGSASQQVLLSAQSLSVESNRLKAEVAKFLSTVRAA